MDSRELLKENLERSMNRVLTVFEGLEDTALIFPTSNGGCHPTWILGHLAYTEGGIIKTIMLGEDNPLEDWKDKFDAGTEALPDASAYPPFAELLKKCRDARGATLATLESLSEADLDKQSANVPPGNENTFGTYRRCLQLVSDHWYMHRGNAADSRRAAQLERAGR